MGKKVASRHTGKLLRPQVPNAAALPVHSGDAAVAPDLIARLLERQWKTQTVQKPLKVQQAITSISQWALGRDNSVSLSGLQSIRFSRID